MEPWRAFLQAIWLFLPCYMANMAPVAAARLFPRWSRPLDGGRLARDGSPLLGANKTWRGLAASALAGALTALLLSFAAAGVWKDLDFGRSRGALLPAIALFGAVLGFMALVGDAIKSYFKRRRSRPAGAPWVPFDQLDIVPTGLLGVALAAPLVGVDWTYDAYFGTPWTVVAIVLATPLLHYASSVLGYLARIKKNPW